MTLRCKTADVQYRVQKNSTREDPDISSTLGICALKVGCILFRLKIPTFHKFPPCDNCSQDPHTRRGHFVPADNLGYVRRDRLVLKNKGITYREQSSPNINQQRAPSASFESQKNYPKFVTMDKR